MKEEFSFIKYISSNYENKRVLVSLLSYELKKTIYFRGDYFRNSIGKSRWLFFIKGAIELCYIFYSFKRHPIKSKRILSLSYFTHDLELMDLGYFIFRPPSSLKRKISSLRSIKLFWLTKRIQYKFQYSNFKYLISDEFGNIVSDFERFYRQVISEYGFEALVVPNDIGFFEKISIKIFKELGKPSFLFSHGGIPNLYDGKMDNSTDYITIWGQRQVDAYVQMGFNPEKFFITGHPFYRKEPSSFRFSYENILVLTKAINGVSPLEEIHLEDPASAILYLLSIQNTLIKIGVKRVKLRPHPSENPDWYRKFLNEDFFEIDNGSLQQALSESSLVIGPISTTIIDAMAHEVNYLIYEPNIDGKTLMGYPITPPIDGLDPKVPVAGTESCLLKLLINKTKIDVSVYKEFAPVSSDLSFIKDIV